MALVAYKSDIDALWLKSKMELTHALAISGTNLKLTRQHYVDDGQGGLTPSGSAIELSSITKSSFQSWLELGTIAYKNSLTLSDIPGKGVANGLATLDANIKIPLSQFPDVILGQLVYGGVFVPSTAKATLSTNAKTKLGTQSNEITLTNDTSAITGYGANEGLYYLAQSNGSFAGITFEVGDWLLSTGSAWKKVDNTDAVTSVNGYTGAVNLGKADVGLGNVGNFKAVSTEASQGLTAAEKSNARTNIGLGSAATYGVYDKTAATAAGSSGTGLVTERGLYYALPSINGGHSYNSGNEIYAPTGAGTAGQFLKSTAGTPTWETFSPSVAWEDGTTAGPKVKITINGVTSAAEAIPSATASKSGAVTTVEQSFAGNKTFTDNIRSNKWVRGDLGVVAGGVGDLSMDGGGGVGTVTSVSVNNGTPVEPDDEGNVNLTLASVALSGSYNDLTDKPTNASASAAGFMSSAQYTKLESIALTPGNNGSWSMTVGSNTVTQSRIGTTYINNLS